MTVLSGQENNSETVAVLPLTGTNIPNSELTIYSDRLDAELFKLKNYIFVERELMSEILTEQGFQQTGCTTDECAVKIGELLGVKFLITGSLGKLESLYTLNLKMIDVETGKIRYKYCSRKRRLSRWYVFGKRRNIYCIKQNKTNRSAIVRIGSGI